LNIDNTYRFLAVLESRSQKLVNKPDVKQPIWAGVQKAKYPHFVFHWTGVESAGRNAFGTMATSL
jgi:hypothetical protein